MHPPAFAIGRVSAVGLCLLLANPRQTTEPHHPTAGIHNSWS